MRVVEIVVSNVSRQRKKNKSDIVQHCSYERSTKSERKREDREMGDGCGSYGI